MADLGDRRPCGLPARVLAVRRRGRARRRDDPFTNAGYDCPGDDDLEHVLGAERLVEALDSTFRIVEACLDRWIFEMLPEEIRRDDLGPDWTHTRGWVIQRVFSHDVYHIAELNEALGIAGLPQVEIWS